MRAAYRAGACEVFGGGDLARRAPGQDPRAPLSGAGYSSRRFFRSAMIPIRLYLGNGLGLTAVVRLKGDERTSSFPSLPQLTSLGCSHVIRAVTAQFDLAQNPAEKEG